MEGTAEWSATRFEPLGGFQAGRSIRLPSLNCPRAGIGLRNRLKSGIPSGNASSSLAGGITQDWRRAVPAAGVYLGFRRVVTGLCNALSGTNWQPRAKSYCSVGEPIGVKSADASIIRDMEYVAGLLFSPDRKHLALIRKSKPHWQAGLYNAIGGKIEPGETPLEAMVREFKEETLIEETSWQLLCILEGTDWKVHFYYSVSDKFLELAERATRGDYDSFDEQPWFFKTHRLPKTIANVPWLIQMALSGDSGKPFRILENAA
jgi:8-oxo-dGTP diphosphatase